MPEDTALKELQAEIKTKTEALQAAIKEAQNPPEGVTPKTADEIKSMTAELKELHETRLTKAEATKAADLLKWLGQVDPADRDPLVTDPDPTKSKPDPTAGKDVGELFTGRDAFKKYEFGTVMPDLALTRSIRELRFGADPVHPAEKAIKALFQTSAGFEPESVRLPTIVGAIHRPIQLLDRVRQVPTTQEPVKWMEQTVRTPPGSRGNTAEGGRYREVAVQFMQRTADIIKKTAVLPATEEQFADVPFIQDIVTTQLPAMLGELIDEDIVNGAGTTGTMIGVRSLTNRLTRTRADDENMYSAIALAMGDVWVSGRATPDMILIHTLDYLGMMLEQTRDGNYLFGMLNMQGQSPWGPPVVQCDFLPRGTYIVGDFGMYHVLRDRQDFRTRVAPRWSVEVTTDPTETSNQTNEGYTHPTGMVNIFSDVRAQNTWLRPQAFCEVS